MKTVTYIITARNERTNEVETTYANSLRQAREDAEQYRCDGYHAIIERPSHSLYGMED